MAGHRSHHYHAVCSWSGSTARGYQSYPRSHQGSAPPSDAVLELSADPAFGGDATLLNPEQLVVLAAASCQLLSFLAVAARSRLDVRHYVDEATAVMVEEGGRGRISAITLRPRITVTAGPGPDRLHRLVRLAHEHCYIANTLSCPVTVEPTFEVLDGYVLGDTPTAEQRLILLARVFGPTSREFVDEYAAHGRRLALDLGCGPGVSTRMLAEAGRWERVIGVDSSRSFLDSALDNAPDLQFLQHDVAQVPFPAALRAAELAYARFLLTHLPDIPGTVRSWLGQLETGGLLLLEDTEKIDTEEPALRYYLELIDRVLAARACSVWPGTVLRQLDPGPLGEVVGNRSTRVEVPVPLAATLFALNLVTWRTDPSLHAMNADIDQLARDLDRLQHTETGKVAVWSMRQLAVRRSGAVDR